ncbi:MAG TPA: tRNA pseudouridine(55) synthase TruB [Terriglobales bacterium]|nr:tRNA pseudouridine(55) synthase TruB [Terriglobales bacterium]
MNGVVIIDKPAGFTSHDVVNRVRRILGQRSVGHLGTLDPMATGVLPLVIGNFTRLAQFYTKAAKTYEGTIRFGFATDTYDAEGEPVGTAQEVSLRTEDIEALAAQFRGLIEQTPPPFSAKKIHGVPAYKLARRQKDVVLKPVQVEIKEFHILAVERDRVRFTARVASGTYLRSVAHEMGQRLGCGAHLESLRRTAVAEFTLAEAHTLDELAQRCESNGRRAIPEGTGAGGPGIPATTTVAAPSTAESLFIHPRKLLPELPCVTTDELTAARIRSGRTVNLPDLSRARQIKVFCGQADLLAIATRVAGTLFHPAIVFSASGRDEEKGSG